MKKLGVIIAVLTMFVACESGPQKRVLKNANGRINNVLVVIKNSEWQGEIGDELRKIVAEPVLGLPQPEAKFEISQIPPENLGSMFRATRSILNIGVGEENSFNIATDVYASPQKVITVIGKTKEDLVKLIQDNSTKIITSFRSADLVSIQRKILKKYWDPAKSATFSKQGYSIKIPKTYSVVEDDGDIVWYRHKISKGESMEIFAYSVPITSEDDENGNNIVATRNAFGKKYIPGEVEGSYMITEEAYTPHVFPINFKERKAFETRGKWEVKGVWMAGPFLSYTVVDKPNNRLIVVEGLTYAPGANKRDYMFEIEAILKTLVIN
ncbi:protein of unknown function [Lutibacter oricola]|uniref:DUF4837 domain-containing protein n=1 Tax=Lutibacter oricola TaxID=762486 RepID=A0A1H2R1Q8_9FLAO|nr:DUF4837 family protein [Lutibacter oricola]SDW13363.1 protein of unknown function [Lutibacter oricola]